MKRQIRSSVFETNSSSTHSVSIMGENYKMDNLKADYGEDYITMTFGDFGWEERSYIDPYTKLQYALTMVIETEGRYNICNSVEEFYDLEGYKQINDVVKSRCGFEVRLDEDSIQEPEYGYTNHEGYIDHQSSEDYRCLQEFLDEYGVSLEDFIFDPKVVLITDNDNH